ncbi:MAG: HlyD family efflux transporter periplasmic adaptor subunit [Rhizobiales bacterium]|nr:HlyD family efflux transporter periplasmic adaptor subunit [Hyphomicrobiales bacterium]
MSSAPSPRDADDLPRELVRRAAPTPARASALRRVWRVARFVPLVMAVMATGGFVAMYFQPPGIRILMGALGLKPGGGASQPFAVPAPPPAPPALPRPGVVAGLGKVLPQGDVVTVSAPFGAGDARVATLHVAEGEGVEAGAPLATFDNAASLRAALDSARAAVSAREAALAQTRANVEIGRREAAATLARLESAAQQAARDFERVEALRGRGSATEQQFEQRRAARDEAAREVERGRAGLARYGRLEDAETQPDVVAARRNVEAAQADVARAAADLDKAVARAPRAGTVLTIHVRPGEKPGAKGLMTLGDLTRMTVEVEIYQTQIGRIAVGDQVEAGAEALDAPLRGVVSRVGLEVARQTVLDPSPAAATDARVVKVTVDLDAESSQRARRFTNLQVVAKIAPGGPR